MTTHELARTLLQCPDVPVVINGWGSDEGRNFEVCGHDEVEADSFVGSNDNDLTPKDKMGYPLSRPCITLNYELRSY